MIIIWILKSKYRPSILIAIENLEQLLFEVPLHVYSFKKFRNGLTVISH